MQDARRRSTDLEITEIRVELVEDSPSEELKLDDCGTEL